MAQTNTQTAPETLAAANARRTELQALREEFSEGLVDVDQARQEYLEEQGLTGFRAEIARGVADSMEDDFSTDVGEVMTEVNENLSVGDDNENLVDSLLGGEEGERNWWDWESGEDALQHLTFSVFGSLYSMFEGSFIGDWLRNTMDRMSGLTEQREAFFNQLRNPGEVLEGLQSKLERVEAAGLPLNSEQMNLGVVTGLITFMQGNEDLLESYEALDASDSVAVAGWWEEALRAFSAEPGNPNIDVESSFVRSVIAVFVGNANWSEVLIDADIDELGREVDAQEMEDIENRDYGEMVPLEESEVSYAGQSVFGRIESFVRDNSEVLAVVSATAVPLNSGARALIGMDYSAYSDPNSETYLMLADLPFDENSELPMQEVFQTMALFLKLEEDGETVMIPDDPTQLAQFIRDKARQEGGRFAHLAHNENLDQVAAAFTGGIPNVGDQIVETTTSIFGNICGFALDFLGSDESEFLMDENRAGIGRLSSYLRSLTNGQNAQAIDHIRDELLPIFRQSDHISFSQLDEVLNLRLREIGLQLYLDGRGYIWIQEQVEGTDNWRNVKKLLVDADHTDAEDRAQELTESGMFGSVWEGLSESASLGIGQLDEFVDAVRNGNMTIAALEGVGLFVIEPLSGVVHKVIPFQFISLIPELFESEDGLSMADVGVSAGNIMTTFMVLGTASGIGQLVTGGGLSGLNPLRIGFNAAVDTIDGVEVMRQMIFAPDKFRTNITARYDLYRSRFVHAWRAIRDGADRRIHRYNLARYQLQQARISIIGRQRALREFARLMGAGPEDKEITLERVEADGTRTNRSIPIDLDHLDDLEDAVDSRITSEGGWTRGRASARVRAEGEGPRVRAEGRMPRARGRGIGRSILVLGSLFAAGAAGQEIAGNVMQDNSEGAEAGTDVERRSLTLPERREIRGNLDGGATTPDSRNEYEGIWNLFRRDDFQDLSIEEYQTGVEASIANHEALVTHLQTEIEANRDMYYNYVADQPGDVVEVAVPGNVPEGTKGFIRLKIEDGELVMHHADGADIRQSFYEDVDAPETTAGTVADLGLRVAPVTGTYMDGRDTFNAVRRGDWNAALRSGAWTIVGGVSDILLAGGAIATGTGIGAIIGVPVAWIGGALRTVRGGRIVTRAVGAIGNSTTAARHSGKAFMAMTGAEIWYAVDRSLFDGDLSHTHTF